MDKETVETNQEAVETNQEAIKDNRIEEKFQPLTPARLEKNEDVYTRALDYALSDSDIKNIAITGLYGAGKSTVWNTYTAYRNLNNIITVILGNYTLNGSVKNALTTDKNPKGCDGTLDDTNRIEQQIINQIIAQIDSDKIPLSKYKIKSNQSKGRVRLRVALVTMLILSILAWLNKEYIAAIWPFSMIYILIPIIIVFIITMVCLLENLFSKGSIRINKINLSVVEADFKEEAKSDESILDRDMKEIVYLLSCSDSNIIVFEDLDRYERVDIFVKLRELNFLLNGYLKANKEERTVKFVYMVRDGLFWGKERTKFFDYIMPIVPVVDSTTSEDELLDILYIENKDDKDNKDNSLPSGVSKEIIRDISIYIDDMRMIRNIGNEYIIYSNIIDLKGLKLNADKLFSLIVLKNIAPKEFEDLQQDRGYVYNAFNSADILRENAVRRHNDEVESLNKEIANLSEQVDKCRIEYIASRLSNKVQLNDTYDNRAWGEILKSWADEKENIETIRIFDKYGSTYKEHTYEDFLETYAPNNEQYRQLKSVSLLNEKIENLKRKKKECNEEIKSIKVFNLRELLSQLSLSELDEYFDNKVFKVSDSYDTIYNIDENLISLIRFFLKEGHIDENYPYYKSFFDINKSKSLFREDRLYIKAIDGGENIRYDLQIKSPGEVLKRLGVDRLSCPNSLNQGLLEYCIQKNEEQAIVNMMIGVQKSRNCINLCEIIKDLQFKDMKKYTGIVIKEFVELFDDIINRLDDQGDYLNRKALLAAIWMNNDCTPLTHSSFLKEHLENNPDIIDIVLDLPESSKDNQNDFWNNLSLIRIKFEKLEGAELSRKAIENLEMRKAYVLTISNISTIVDTLADSKVTYGEILHHIYYSDQLKATKEYIKENFVDFLKMYIGNAKSETVYNNDEAIIAEIIETEIPEELKIQYLNHNKMKITDLNIIKVFPQFYEICNQLFEKRTISLNPNNIKLYWESSDEYDSAFIKYLNTFSIDQLEPIFEEIKGLGASIIDDMDLGDTIFEYLVDIVESKVTSLDVDFLDKRISMLIAADLLEVNDNIMEELLKPSRKEVFIAFLKGSQQNLIVKWMIEHKVSEDLLYMVLNDDIQDDCVHQIVDFLGPTALVENIQPTNKEVIPYILENYLTRANIIWICEHFTDFQYQAKFLDKLSGQDKLDEIPKKYLIGDVMNFALEKSELETDKKVSLLINLISSTDLDDYKGTFSQESLDPYIRRYISSIGEVANIATAWDGKRPEPINVYEKKIVEPLIDYKYLKRVKGSNKVIKNRN